MIKIGDNSTVQTFRLIFYEHLFYFTFQYFIITQIWFYLDILGGRNQLESVCVTFDLD